MKTAQLVGLIAAGNLTDAPLTRFGPLAERLGPVKSASFRVASRIANMLRAGHPVKDFADFEDCSLILICVPDQTLPDTMNQMLRSPISWRRKAVVLCSTALDSGDLRDLAAQGASVASLSAIPGFDDQRYLVEGDQLAIRLARSLVEYRDRRAFAIERSLKPFYLAALTCTSTLLSALLGAAFESLRHAGLPAARSSAILDRQINRAFRSFVKAGRRAYSSPLQLHRQLRALSSASPELAYYVEQSCRLAERFMEMR